MSYNSVFFNYPELLFDSSKYKRNLKVNAKIFSQDSTVLNNEIILCDRIVIWQTDFYKRFNICFSNKKQLDAYNNLNDKYCDYRKEYGDSVYIALSFNLSDKKNDYIVIYISAFSSYFTEEETVSGCYMCVSTADDDSFIFVDGRKMENIKYGDFLSSRQDLTNQELDFINDTMEEQKSETWFPTQKEFREVKRKIDTERIKKKFFIFKNNKEKEIQSAVIVNGKDEFVNIKSLKINNGSDNPERELESLIGLNNIKEDIIEMQRYLQFKQNRETRGLSSEDDNATLHMCYLGRPGTGKTTIARIMTGMLYNMKYIKENKYVEVNGLDMKGGFIGQTAIITKQIIDTAKGGVLFIDEAYSLCDDDSNSFGKEAISVLLKEMEDNRHNIVVIFAGYKDDVDKFLDTNSGFRSRINKYFEFTDYTSIELGHILTSFLKKMHLKIEKDALHKCMSVFNTAKQHNNFSNGRFVRNLAEQVEETHILNISKNVNIKNIQDKSAMQKMDTITTADIPDKLVKKLLTGM